MQFRWLISEYVNELFPRKLTLSHNREQCPGWQDIAFWDYYKQFLTCIGDPNEGGMAPLALVACFGKPPLLHLRNNMSR